MAVLKDTDRGWKKIQRELRIMNRSFVKVGVLSDAGRFPTAEGGANIADVATFNEFGTSTIPSRPFMGQSFDKNRRAINRFIVKKQSDIYQARTSTRRALDSLGIFFVGKVKQIFTTGKFQPVKPATVARKGSTRPLIDTGRLRASINHEVKL